MNTTATEAAAGTELQAGAWSLRPWREDDLEGLYRTVKSSLDELGRWLPWAQPDYSREHTRDWIARCRLDWQQGRAFPFGVFDHDGEVLGSAGISQIDGVHRRGNLGYWTATAASGQGVARAAARAVAAFGFRELRLCRLEVVVVPQNTASRRVAAALGAQWECTARHRVQHGGQPMDAEIYALLPADLGLAT